MKRRLSTATGLLLLVGVAVLADEPAKLLPAKTGETNVHVADGQAAFDRKDYAAALQLWQQLATQGNADAQYNLGRMYDRSKGILNDDIQAAKWYRMAADQGNAKAQFVLGQWYQWGNHGLPNFRVAENIGEALRLYRLAANQGNAEAQYFLGNLYDESQGVPLDFAEALKWYSLAANQGYGLAQLQLGYSYVYGHGVPQDPIQAYMWSDLAAGSIPLMDTINRTQAVRNRDLIVAKKMTRVQIAEAQRLAHEWLAMHPKP
jgi:uncharacterized protein